MKAVGRGEFPGLPAARAPGRVRPVSLIAEGLRWVEERDSRHKSPLPVADRLRMRGHNEHSGGVGDERLRGSRRNHISSSGLSLESLR